MAHILRHDSPAGRGPRSRRAWWLIVAGLLVFASAAGPAADEPREFSHGVLIRFEGPITPRLEQYLYRKLEVARQQKADLLIIEIESPGGLLDASEAIAERLRDINWAHTVAYVPKMALSGAAIAALGCDEIIMAPQARFGDAGPIFQDEDFLFRHAPEKIRSDLARVVRDLAEAKGRPPALAEAMVDMQLEVYRVKNRTTGKETFMSDDEIQAADNPEDWEKIKLVLESRKDKFLEVNGTRAVELHLAEATAAGREDLRRRYKLEKDELTILRPTGVDTAVYILNLPIVTGLLIVIGLVGLYVEFSAPGIGLGGLIAALCFGIFFWSRFLGGTAEWLEVGLFGAGVVFLLVELFVLPGFGLAGLTGFILLTLSLVLASQPFLIPEKNWQFSLLAQTLLMLLASGAGFLVAAFALSKYLGELPILGRLTLRPPDASDAAGSGAGVSGEVSRHFQVEIGDRGIADSALRPAGRARFGENYIDVVTEGAFVDSGTEVRVLKVTGNRVLVRRVEDPA